METSAGSMSSPQARRHRGAPLAAFTSNGPKIGSTIPNVPAKAGAFNSHVHVMRKSVRAVYSAPLKIIDADRVWLLEPVLHRFYRN